VSKIENRIKSGITVNTTDSITCIIVGVDNKPRVVYVDDFYEKSAAIKQRHGRYDHPLWFPREIVFKMDEKFLARLEAAHKKGNRRLVQTLVRKAERWKPH
jgi:hypothetical protein